MKYSDGTLSERKYVSPIDIFKCLEYVLPRVQIFCQSHRSPKARVCWSTLILTVKQVTIYIQNISSSKSSDSGRMVRDVSSCLGLDTI